MSRARNKRTTADKHLVAALTKAYAARARLFHEGVKASKIDLLIAEIDGINTGGLDWSDAKLGISQAAMLRVQEAGGLPHQVFAHPAVVMDRPHVIAYYRNLATISKKGVAQLLFPTEAFEQGSKTVIDEQAAVHMCAAFNRIMSEVIGHLPGYTVTLSRQAILAEIGTELQGTWANVVGQGAAKAVEAIMGDYVEERDLGRHVPPRRFDLTNGWKIVFGNEPDAAFFDAEGVKQIAIEIKGSLDVAGAQTRYGEAKKSFGKQLRENPRCHTVYLASCFTDAVIEQIRDDGQVREWFNLTSILYDADERRRFLGRIFHIVTAPR